jgi:hypothetical protein
MLNASALSFLGLGAQPPTPEWGAMLSEGRAHLREAPWIEDALREMLARQQKATERVPVRLTTVSGHGLLPGAVLDDSAALLSSMEASNDPA